MNTDNHETSAFIRSCLWRMVLGCLFMLCASYAYSQPFPSKPLRIVTAPPGGSLDITARLIAQRLAERFAQPVIVDNRGGMISMETVAKAPADGHTLLVASASLWLSEFLRGNVAWDAFRDYAPITQLTTSPNVIMVHPALPVASLRDLMALARVRPRELLYSTGQSGASAHLAGELFKHLAGVTLTRIAYKGQGAAMLSLVTGEAQVSFPNAATGMPFIKAGKAKGLAVTALQPSALAPGLPAAAAAGLPGYESRAILGLYAPAKTPVAIIDLLHRETTLALNDSGIRKRLFDTGADATPTTPAELTEAMKSEQAITGKLIKTLGIRAE
jgi:tripartite-type tricarboxylate transporter receptor subunit TctC